MPDIDTDVIIVGAAPTGLMLAGELRLAGVRTLVLERLPEPWAVPKAGGLGGQILDLLHYRGLLERFETASGKPRPTPDSRSAACTSTSPNSPIHPMQALLLPQPELEALLEETRRRSRCRDPPRTRGGRAEPGRRRGDRGRARTRRAVPGDRPVPGGLRRRAQPRSATWQESRSPASPTRR